MWSNCFSEQSVKRISVNVNAFDLESMVYNLWDKVCNLKTSICYLLTPFWPKDILMVSEI